jgi:hypothetical protein
MAVVALEIKTRQALAGGQEFGSVGRYLQLDGPARCDTPDITSPTGLPNFDFPR